MQLHEVIRGWLSDVKAANVDATYKALLTQAKKRNRVLQPFSDYTCVVCEKCHLNEAMLRERSDNLVALWCLAGWMAVSRWREVILDHNPRGDKSMIRVWVPTHRKKYFPPGKCDCKEL